MRRKNWEYLLQQKIVVSVNVKNLQNETSFGGVNHADELNNIKNSVSQESGRNKRKLMKETEAVSSEKGLEKLSSDNMRQMKK